MFFNLPRKTVYNNQHNKHYENNHYTKCSQGNAYHVFFILHKFLKKQSLIMFMHNFVLNALNNIVPWLHDDMFSYIGGNRIILV